MISNDQLDKLERLANAATPGPWYTHEDDPRTILAWDGDCNGWEIASVEIPDAEYICAANPAVVLELIARVRQLEAEADWLADNLAECTGVCTGIIDDCAIVTADGAPVDACLKCWREAARKACDTIPATP